VPERGPVRKKNPAKQKNAKQVYKAKRNQRRGAVEKMTVSSHWGKKSASRKKNLPKTERKKEKNLSAQIQNLLAPAKETHNG